MSAPKWSATRARTFAECPRKYWYRYHLAQLGRRPDSPPEAQEAWRVRDLMGPEAFAGEVVHRCIEGLLALWRGGHRPTEADAVRLALRRLAREFRDSQDYWGSHPDAFIRRPPLLDGHYRSGPPLSPDRAERLRETVAESIRAFVRSSLAERILRVGPRDWLPVDRNFSARLAGGIQLLVRPDFAFREGGRLWIVDWKTGQPDPYWEDVQIVCYVLYAAEKWDFSPERIVPLIVHLYPGFRVSDTEYSEENLARVTLLIQESCEAMVAAAAGEEFPPAERFPMTEEAARCHWCAFRHLCDGARRCAL